MFGGKKKKLFRKKVKNLSKSPHFRVLCLEHTDTCEKTKRPEQLKLCGQLDMYERIAGLAIATYFVISHVKY